MIHEECELIGLDTVKPKNAAYTPATSKFSGDVYSYRWGQETTPRSPPFGSVVGPSVPISFFLILAH